MIHDLLTTLSPIIFASSSSRDACFSFAKESFQKRLVEKRVKSRLVIMRTRYFKHDSAWTLVSHLLLNTKAAISYETWREGLFENQNNVHRTTNQRRHCGKMIVMCRTPFYRTLNGLEHQFSNIERTRTCSSFESRTSNGHRTNIEHYSLLEKINFSIFC